MPNNSKRKWSKKVNETSDALDIEKDVFTWDDPIKIAKSLKQSALSSHRRQGTPYQAAMSMLNFYINRAGSKLSSAQKEILSKAKEELHHLFKQD